MPKERFKSLPDRRGHSIWFLDKVTGNVGLQIVHGHSTSRVDDRDMHAKPIGRTASCIPTERSDPFQNRHASALAISCARRVSQNDTIDMIEFFEQFPLDPVMLSPVTKRIRILPTRARLLDERSKRFFDLRTR